VDTIAKRNKDKCIVKLDHIVSVIIALRIIKMTGDGIKKVIQGLMDSSSQVEQSKIRNLIKNVTELNRFAVSGPS